MQPPQTRRGTTVGTNGKNTGTPLKQDPKERAILLAVLGLVGSLIVTRS